MSDYSKTTNFTAKDSLPSGNAGKIIKGSEFDTEFDAIETAIATKQDIANVVTIARAHKTASESKTTDTTLANDGALVLSGLAAGQYIIEAQISLSVGAGGLRYDFVFSGTQTSGDGNTLELASSDAVGTGIATSPGDGPYTFGESGNSALWFKGAIVVSTTGNLAFQWAQSSSNAAATTVRANSTLYAIRTA